MKKIIIFLLCLTFLIVLGFFTFNKVKTTEFFTPKENEYSNADKMSSTVVTGKISFNQGNFFIQEAGKIPMEIDSLSVDLSQFVGQTVEVIGKYSGEILFVGELN